MQSQIDDEVEAKFVLESKKGFKQIANLAQILDYGLEVQEEKLQGDTYFDTEDYTLLNCRMAFRVREKGDTLLVTLKTPKQQDSGIFERGEIEEEIAPNQIENLVRCKLDMPSVKMVREVIKGKKLKPVLIVNNYRRTINLVKDDKVHFEMSLDQGFFEGLKGKKSFLEIEIEAKFGDKKSLKQISNSLVKQYKLVPSDMSKFERGIKLVC